MRTGVYANGMRWYPWIIAQPARRPQAGGQSAAGRRSKRRRPEARAPQAGGRVRVRREAALAASMSTDATSLLDPLRWPGRPRRGATEPKRNRVTPMGEVIATPLRGAWTGNRGN